MSVKGNTRKDGENTGEMGGHRWVDQMLKIISDSLFAVLFRIKRENSTGNGDIGKCTWGNAFCWVG